MDAVTWLVEECKVDKPVALVALRHARGSVLVARDYLSNEVIRQQYTREVREFSLDE